MYAGLAMASINNNGNSVANFDNIALIESGTAPVASTLSVVNGQNPSVGNNFTVTAIGSGTPTWSWEKVTGPGTLTFSTQNTRLPKSLSRPQVTTLFAPVLMMVL